MVKVQYQNNHFDVSGSIDLGYIGYYASGQTIQRQAPRSKKPNGGFLPVILEMLNKTMSGDVECSDDSMVKTSNNMLRVGASLEEIAKSMESSKDDSKTNGKSWAYLREYTTKTYGENVARAIEQYWNDQERKAQANQKQLNDTMLSFLLFIMESRRASFWKYARDILIVDKFPYNLDEIDNAYKDEYDDMGIEEAIYNNNNIEKLKNLHQDFFDTGIPNDGSIDKPDFEQQFRKFMPMFDLNKYLTRLNLKSLTLEGSCMVFNFDDGMTSKYILENVSANIMPNLRIENFCYQ